MNTKMITYLTLCSMVLPSMAKFGFPKNVNFHTKIYNTSNCSMTPFKNYSLPHMCFKTNIVDGYPECCHDLFNDISVFPNSTIGQCIKTNMTFTNRTGVKYDCNLTNFKQLSMEETFSYVGIILTFLLAVTFIMSCGWCLCGGSRKKYNRI